MTSCKEIGIVLKLPTSLAVHDCSRQDQSYIGQAVVSACSDTSTKMTAQQRDYGGQAVLPTPLGTEIAANESKSYVGQADLEE